MKNKIVILYLISLSLFSTVYASDNNNIRNHINLSGLWQFQLDTSNVGIKELWYTRYLTDKISLPGTTDENLKGFRNTNSSETTMLTRNWKYVGKAWYRKEIQIPAEWKGKVVQLSLERTKPTKVWVNSTYVGTNDAVSVPHVYDLTSILKPGQKQSISILVDNGSVLPYEIINSHAYSEHTQTNWNGILGDFKLEALDPIYISSLNIYPDLKNKKIKIKVELINYFKENKQLSFQFKNSLLNNPDALITINKQFNTNLKNEVFWFELPLGDNLKLWSEFTSMLYKLSASILEGNKEIDNTTIEYGLRDFVTHEKQFLINGNKTFLRGKHDGCIFPITGYPPMDVEGWRKYFKTVKEYGVNHVRFHSWCPPEACFKAADIEGIYLQVELPLWGTVTRDKHKDILIPYLKNEAQRIITSYGNHPSFVMFGLGNELFGDQDVFSEIIDSLKSKDKRHLYSCGANNYLGFNSVPATDDFHVTCRIGKDIDSSFNNHVRASFSFADAYDGGYIYHSTPNSIMNFSSGIAKSNIPVIGHETGQFQFYPDFSEIDKYKGVLNPINLNVFKNRLEKAGMLDQATDFLKASGKLAALLYRADIEMNLRTPGMAGFQLLDLQDYPGQGTALVGILNAFMENKGLITPKEWRSFCSQIVLLFSSNKFIYTNNEQIAGNIMLYNFSDSKVSNQTISWSLVNSEKKKIANGSIPIDVPQGCLSNAVKIEIPLGSISKAEKVELKLSLSDTEICNNYSFWVYPANTVLKQSNNISVTKSVNKDLFERLSKGESILLFPKSNKLDSLTVGGMFPTDYWNYRMFKSVSEYIKKPVSPGTMGILTNPNHPLFKNFPTDFHSNWQWFSIIKNSRPFILDNTNPKYRPIVQVIDNIERNHKLGLIFEFKIGQGKLLVCMSNLLDLSNRPEAIQLYNSLIDYMSSSNFSPTEKLTPEELRELFSRKIKSEGGEVLMNISPYE